MANRLPKTFLLFLGIFLVMNLVQSFFTEIIYDEAYYWYYAQQLNWGYFDHPPMVALMIWLSGLFFEGELGIRFMSCLMSAGTLVILWQLIEDERKNKFIPHFFLLALAMALFNAYGFLTLPDTPLLFFTALFLWVYKRFLNVPSLFKALALGVVMACLMYSKYHAVLVIVFVLLSNISLVKNKYAWVAVIVSLLCYTPHLIWLFEHDFVSVNYHISERPNHPYSFGEFTLGYLLNLIVNFGLLFPWFYWALFTSKPKDKFEKALVYLTYGVIFFFFMSSFAKRTQAQWVIVICIPMFILAYNHLLKHEHHRKWMYRVALVSFVILLYARLWLVFQPLLPKVFETHGNKKWVTELQEFLGDTPAVFENSYREASMYAFYSSQQSFSLNNAHYRRNQYSIDSSEAQVQHQKVGYLSKYVKSGDFEYLNPGGDKVFVNYIDNFESFRKLQCFIDNETIDLNEKEQLLKIYNPYEADIPFEKIDLQISYLNAYKQLKSLQPLSFKLVKNDEPYLKAKDTTMVQFTLPEPKMEHPSYLRFSIRENGLQPAINSHSIKIEE